MTPIIPSTSGGFRGHVGGPRACVCVCTCVCVLRGKDAQIKASVRRGGAVEKNTGRQVRILGAQSTAPGLPVPAGGLRGLYLASKLSRNTTQQASPGWSALTAPRAAGPSAREPPAACAGRPASAGPSPAAGGPRPPRRARGTDSRRQVGGR